MPTAADLEARAIWKLEQAGYGVTIHPGHGYIINPSGHAIAPPTSLDELRALADQLYEPVWLAIGGLKQHNRSSEIEQRTSDRPCCRLQAGLLRPHGEHPRAASQGVLWDGCKLIAAPAMLCHVEQEVGMANEEHLAILRQGVDIWNAWRRANPDVQPDLTLVNLWGLDLEDANLSGANLDGAHLHAARLHGVIFDNANLQGAIFQGADLSRAAFLEARLRGTDLRGTDLRGANLGGAHLHGADLHAASLDGANLITTNFHAASLQEVDFTRTRMGKTIFADVDLREVKGLDSVRHIGPSHISIDTLYRSKGQIPEIFLRGCGVPDSMIEYAHALVTAERPIDYYSVFISYSSHDEALAERLYADLQARGVRCWLAPHDLTPGEVIVRGIDEAIQLHDTVVLLLSEAAVKSHWVAYEVELVRTREAAEGRTLLYPLRLDDAVLTTTQGWAKALREGRHIGDFRQWTEYAAYQAVFGRLLRDLKAEQQ